MNFTDIEDGDIKSVKGSMIKSTDCEVYVVKNSRISHRLYSPYTEIDNDCVYSVYTEGMTVYMMDDRFFEIAEEVEYEMYIYPTKKEWTIDDVRYMQWNMLGNVGTHWYAKIGKRDIYDSEDNMKWNTKEEAEKAAKWFLTNKIKSK